MSDQEQLNVCPKCGAQMDDGICRNCGYETTGQPVRDDNEVYGVTDVYESQSAGDVYKAQTGEDIYRSASEQDQSQDIYGSASEQDQSQDIYGSASEQVQSQDIYGAASEQGRSQDIYGSVSEQDRNQDMYGSGTDIVTGIKGGRFSGISPTYNDGYGTQYGGTPYMTDQSGSAYSGSGVETPYPNNGNAYSGGGAGTPYPNNGNAYSGNGAGAPYPNNGNAYTGNTGASYPNNGGMYTGGASYQGYDSDYGKNRYQNTSDPYGANNYGWYNGYDNGMNNPYSPFAIPQKKKNTGLIVGVIIGVIVLFLIAIFALLYRAFASLNKEERRYEDYNNDDYYNDGYDFDDDYDFDYGYDDDYGYDGNYGYGNDYFYDYGDDDFYDYGDGYGYGNVPYYDYDFGGGYDDDYGDDYDYDSDEYYTLHNDIKDDLSYTVEIEDLDYDADNDNVSISVSYPVISGNNVPNLDKINSDIEKKVTGFTDNYEDIISSYPMGEDDEFIATVEGYVTYMTEDVLSIVFKEDGYYSAYYGLASLYCINIDMKDGVIMENTGIIDVDDEFSIDFRKRSDIQNGAYQELATMTDQQITEYLKSKDNLIIFYTPQGMEIGFNHPNGWVTVTYKDYEDFLKIF